MQTRIDTRSESERTADSVLVGLRGLVFPALVGVTWTAWRSRNRKALVDMARAGMTADQILEAWKRESQSAGEPIRSIAHLQSRLNATRPGRHIVRGSLDDVPAVVMPL